jgi:hypothetical protein
MWKSIVKCIATSVSGQLLQMGLEMVTGIEIEIMTTSVGLG